MNMTVMSMLRKNTELGDNRLSVQTPIKEGEKYET